MAFVPLLLLVFTSVALSQSTVNVRVMAANLNGSTQSYQPFAIRILQGTKADVVAIQEFNYNNNTASDFRSFVDTCFGTNFVYYREPYTGNGDIPNGIISRYPIINSGSWVDTQMSSPNRGFAWAQIDLPGSNDLYVISVHLLTSSASARASEAAALKNLVQTNFPTNAWVVIAGDFNTDSRTESAMVTFDSFLSDYPIPVDNIGNSDTSGNRNHPHDYVLPSFSFTNSETATIFPSHSFPSGLVFDSTVYTPLSDVTPVQFSDSTNAQHMAVMKDFLVATNDVSSTAPSISVQPQSQAIQPGSNVTFTVTASGTLPLSYQWVFNSTNILSSLTNFYSITNVQPTNAGNYTVIVTNNFGSITSSIAVLTITNLPPSISAQPQNLTVNVGDIASFSVTAAGANPLAYQWRFNGTNIANATNTSYSITSSQLTNAGSYAVVVTNISGSITSSAATLSVLTTQAIAFVQWNFNSVTPDGSPTTGSTTPSLGSGTASLVGGVAINGTGFATGDTNYDAAGSNDNTAWNTSTYPALSSNNKTAGAQFNVSTAGKKDIAVSWSQRSSNTGGKYFRLQYSTNGTTFWDFPAAAITSTNFIAFTNNLASFTGINNNSNFAFRIVAEFESTAITNANAQYVAAFIASTYSSSGTTRFDMVTVSGTTIPPSSPAIPAVLGSAAAISGNQFQFTVTGTAGSNYIVQVSTNLAVSNWVSVFTNPSPFTFTDTNINTVSQRFFRAVAP